MACACPPKRGPKWSKNGSKMTFPKNDTGPFGVSLEVFLARSEASLSCFDLRRAVCSTYPECAFQTMHALQWGPTVVYQKERNTPPLGRSQYRGLIGVREHSGSGVTASHRVPFRVPHAKRGTARGPREKVAGPSRPQDWRSPADSRPPRISRVAVAPLLPCPAALQPYPAPCPPSQTASTVPYLYLSLSLPGLDIRTELKGVCLSLFGLNLGLKPQYFAISRLWASGQSKRKI